MLIAEEGAELLGYDHRDTSRWKDSEQETSLHQLLERASCLPRQAKPTSSARPLIPRNTPSHS